MNTPTLLIGGLAILVLSVIGAQEARAQVASSTSSLASPCTLTVSPASIAPGSHSTLSWNATGSNAGMIDNGVGPIYPAPDGSIIITPATTTTYTGTFSGLNGTTTCQTTITVSQQETPVPVETQSTMPSVPLPQTLLQQTQGAGTTSDSAASTSVGVSPTTTSLLSPAPVPSASQTPAPEILQIDASGHALIRGTIRAIGSNSIILNSWGGVWIIKTDNASVTPTAGATNDLSQLHVGDFVGVSGSMSTNEVYTINASVVHDWTLAPSSSTSGAFPPNVSGNASSVSIPTPNPTTTISSNFGSPQRYTGVARNVDPTSGTLTIQDGIFRNVTTSGSTQFTDGNGNATSLSAISNGDRIRVDGLLQPDGSIAASAVRDVTLGIQDSIGSTAGI